MTTEQDIRDSILRLINKRAVTSSICPSEVARSFSSSEAVWRPLMEPIRRIACEMAQEGDIVIKQKGEVVEPTSDFHGPIRLAKPAS